MVTVDLVLEYAAGFLLYFLVGVVLFKGLIMASKDNSGKLPERIGGSILIVGALLSFTLLRIF